MPVVKLISLFIIVCLCSCKQAKKHKANPAVRRLTAQVMTLTMQLNNPDSCRKAISYLDSATTIDNTCFSCYYEKLMFLNALKQYNKVISTLDTCIKLRPNAQDLYLTAGVMHENLGDTTLSKTYFKKSLTICNSVLDTMNEKNRDYITLTTNKAINLIMLGDSIRAKQILWHLYSTQPENSYFDSLEKNYTLSLMNKSKAELLDTLFNPETYSH